MSTNPTNGTLDAALKSFTYGFYLLATRADSDDLTTRDQDWVSVGTVSWVSQSSFEPPLITVAIQKDSDLNETIQKSQAFSISVLGQREEALIERFAGKTEVDYSDNAVNGIAYREGKSGAPILDCGVATIECTLVDALTTPGDHLLFVGKVVNATVNNDDTPICEKDTQLAYEGVSERS